MTLDEKQYNEMMTTLKSIKTDVHSINRAVYGDPPNKVPGLIDRQIQDEKDIQSLKDEKKRMRWMAAGFILALQGLWEFFKAKFY